MKQKRVSKPALLRSATPYPWRRNYKGDLYGADGRPVFFRDADAVLVEHSPQMAEALVVIHTLADGRRDSARPLKQIAAVAARILGQMEKSSRKPNWCRGSIS